MSEERATPTTPHCYRCDKLEQAGEPFRLLPGSSHITLCPACYTLVWGWRDQPAGPPDGAGPAGRVQSASDH
jgi:hypothetical protein